MIFDEYSARLRGLQFQFARPEETRADELLHHDEKTATVGTATAEMDQLSAIVERDRRGLSRGTMPARS